MKKITTYAMLLLSLLMFFDSAQAQSPEGFVYQAQLRDKRGHALRNKKLKLNVMILSSPDENSIVWERLYKVRTDRSGMVSLVIEDGETPYFPAFSEIDWGHGTYYLYIELKNNHGVRGIGDPVLLYSVPYALHAKTCDNGGIDTSELEVGDILQFNGVGFEPATFSFYYQDKDADGYGNENGFVYSPVRPTGFVDLGGDTDDHNPEINPGMDEICGDGIDNNSDGVIDEFCNTDDDGDGYTELQGDCNDQNDAIYPGAFEIIDDGIDNNCNGQIDEDLSLICRDAVISVLDYAEENCPNDASCLTDSPDYIYFNDCVDFSCLVSMYNNQPSGYLLWTSEEKADYLIGHCGVIDSDGDGYAPVDGDLDDSEPSIYPGSPEICGDNIDNNQNGYVDEACDPNGDFDGDGYTPNQGDCDDIDANTYPGAPELADEIDNNCNGEIDEGVFDDNDGDGYSVADGDCDDANPDLNPGALEICRDGIDNNCDGQIDEECDVDGDGFTIDEGDCDDFDPEIYPGAVEILDELDNDCDGEIDEGFDLSDLDGDGISVAYGDCDDNDATVFPDATELIDGIDNDCDGELIFEEIDHDGDGYIPGIIDPESGWKGDPNVIGGDDWDDENPNIHPNAIDICDGIDNDLDGEVDEDCDSDGDGYTRNDGDCNNDDPLIHPGATELINGIDDNCDGQLSPNEKDYDGDGYISGVFDENTWQGSNDVIGGNDCNDEDININPSAEELINGIDDNCDGLLDPDEMDNDGDNYIPGEYNQSTIWLGSPTIHGGGDCDDNNSEINPGVPELINGIDDNCDGQLNPDEIDNDGDGYIPGIFDSDTGWLGSASVIGDNDCNDAIQTVYPGAPELIDGLDNNCDGQLDPNEIDNDGDGFIIGSIDPNGWNTYDSPQGGGDCDDNNELINPMADDIPDDGIDQNCDGEDAHLWYKDLDNDGYGDQNNEVVANTQPSGYVSNNEDCDDTNQNIYPGAPELIDGLDNNCDGQLNPNEIDNDGDGYVPGQIDSSGWFGSPNIIGGGDCNDNNGSINPGATEVVGDNVDNNCNGEIDETSSST
jgi:hypothetical protein